MNIKKSVPDTSSDHEREFWNRVTEGELCVQHCHACGENNYPPRFVCPNCYSSNWSLQEIDGRGTVYGYTVIHRPSTPQFEDELPIVSAIVEVTEGPHIMGKINCTPDEIESGIPVEFNPSALDDDNVRISFDLV